MQWMPDECIGVIGLGLMGRGIAACFLGHGYRVIGFARNAEEHAEAREPIAAMVAELADRRGDAALRDHWSTSFHATSDFRDFADCCLVVESVPEDIETKQSIFTELERVVPASTVLASNTSATPIQLLQKSAQRPERLIGMHWAEPAHLTRFLELICGEATSPATRDMVIEIARRLGKEPSVCRQDIPGFIVNRVAYAMYREVCHLLETGVADAETIDVALRNTLGLWATLCGPLRWIDLTGGPQLYAQAMQRVLPTLSNATDLPPALQALAASGARGIVNGRGFFDYTPEEARQWRARHERHAARASAIIDEYYPLRDGRSTTSDGGQETTE
jgi:3-hydroxybutyryl-CoA dehydrogenase